MMIESMRVRNEAGILGAVSRVLSGKEVVYCSRAYTDMWSRADRDAQAYMLGAEDAEHGREPLWYRVGGSYVSAETGHIGPASVGEAYLAGYARRAQVVRP